MNFYLTEFLELPIFTMPNLKICKKYNKQLGNLKMNKYFDIGILLMVAELCNSHLHKGAKKLQIHLQIIIPGHNSENREETEFCWPIIKIQPSDPNKANYVFIRDHLFAKMSLITVKRCVVVHVKFLSPSSNNRTNSLKAVVMEVALKIALQIHFIYNTYISGLIY